MINDDDDGDDDKVFVKRYVLLSFQTYVRSKCYFIPIFLIESNGNVFYLLLEMFLRIEFHTPTNAL